MSNVARFLLQNDPSLSMIAIYLLHENDDAALAHAFAQNLYIPITRITIDFAHAELRNTCSAVHSIATHSTLKKFCFIRGAPYARTAPPPWALVHQFLQSSPTKRNATKVVPSIR